MSPTVYYRLVQIGERKPAVAAVVAMTFCLLTSACTGGASSAPTPTSSPVANSTEAVADGTPLDPETYASFLFNSGQVGGDISLTAAEIKCIEAELLVDRGLVERVISVSGASDLPYEDLAKIVAHAMDCAPTAIVTSVTATGFGDDAQEFGVCFIQTLNPANERREQALIGVFRLGNGEVVPPDITRPVIDLYDACMPTQVVASIIKSRLLSQPELTVALREECLVKLIEGPQRRSFITALLVPTTADDRRFVDQAISGCTDLGLFAGALWETEFGDRLAATTIDCLSETAERFDIYEVLSDSSAYESWETESRPCYQQVEAQRLDEQGRDEEVRSGE